MCFTQHTDWVAVRGNAGSDTRFQNQQVRCDVGNPVADGGGWLAGLDRNSDGVCTRDLEGVQSKSISLGVSWATALCVQRSIEIGWIAGRFSGGWFGGCVLEISSGGESQ